MKTIRYDPKNYEVIHTIQFDNDLFQKVQFPDGNYGIVFVMPDDNIYDVILVGTDNDDTYCNIFMDFARNQTEVLNNIRDNIDEVELHVHLTPERSEAFKQVVSKEEADDLIERLKIANEILEMEKEHGFNVNRAEMVLICILIICIVINLISATHNLGGI